MDTFTPTRMSDRGDTIVFYDVSGVTKQEPKDSDKCGLYLRRLGAVTSAPLDLTRQGRGKPAEVTEEVHSASVDISTNDLLSMHSVGKMVLPAPGIGKKIRLISAVLYYQYATTAYTDASNADLVFSFGTTTGPRLHQVPIKTLVTANENGHLQVNGASSIVDVSTPVYSVVNQPLIMSLSAAIAGGDSGAKLKVVYLIDDVDDQPPRGVVSQLTDRATGYTYLIYIPVNYVISAGSPVIFNYRQTASVANVANGSANLAEMNALTTHEYGGQLGWPYYAELYNCAIICFNCITDGQTGNNYTFMKDIEAAQSILADLNARGWIKSNRENRLVTGMSSGGTSAGTHAIVYPEDFGWCVVRHSCIVTTGNGIDVPDPGVFSAQANFNFNTFGNSIYGPNGAGIGSNGRSFDWRTNVLSKNVKMIHFNGSNDPLGYLSYEDWTVLFYNLAATYGYSINNINGMFQKVFQTPDDGTYDPQTCDSYTSPVGWPHACHSEDRDITAAYFLNKAYRDQLALGN